jgi:hypothetical protein
MSDLLTGTGTIVRGPALEPLANALTGAHWSGPGELSVPDVPPEEVGDLAHELALPLHGLAPLEPSLEASYMKLTAGSVEYVAEPAAKEPSA